MSALHAMEPGESSLIPVEGVMRLVPVVLATERVVGKVMTMREWKCARHPEWSAPDTNMGDERAREHIERERCGDSVEMTLLGQTTDEVEMNRQAIATRGANEANRMTDDQQPLERPASPFDKRGPHFDHTIAFPFFGMNDEVLIKNVMAAPHTCDDEKCPGNINRKKLALFNELLYVLLEMDKAAPHPELGQLYHKMYAALDEAGAMMGVQYCNACGKYHTDEKHPEYLGSATELMK